MEYLITNEFRPTRVDEIVDYLRGPRLWIRQADYPDLDDWLQRVHGDLRAERKRAVVAFESGSVVGAVLYQCHRSDLDALEIKNITVRPDHRGRHLASFLLRNAEIEGARDFGSLRVVCDAKRSNAAIRGFLLTHRYVVAGTADLYGLGAGEDLIFGKSLIVRAAG